MRSRLHRAGNAAFLCFLLLSSIVSAGWAQSYPLWGPLQSGPYPVGFKTTWQLDYTRTYHTVLEDSTRYAPTKAPRPILINVWYPAHKDEGARAMAYEEYLNTLSSDPSLQPFSRAFVAYTRDVIVNEVFDKPEHELKEREQRAWEGFLETPTAAFKEATPAPGPFPLVVYRSGAGSSYEDNSVLCEYLASHGYIVVGSAFQYADGTSFGTESGEASMPDLAFLIAYAQQMLPVDWHKIAVGGHSAGAQAALRFRAKPQSVVDALFLLDTTQDYHSLSNPLWSFTQPVLENAASVTGPMLIVAGPAAIFQLMDRLDRADRYYLTIDEVGHNEFISQGVMRKRLAAQYSLAQGDGEENDVSSIEQERRVEALAQRFQVICAYLRTFLDAHLKEEPDAMAALERWFRTTQPGPEPHVEYVPVGATAPEPYRPTASGPPTPRQLRRFFDEQGLDATRAVLERFWSGDTTHAIYDKTYGFVWVYELLGNGETRAAQTLFNQYDTFNEEGVSGAFFRYCTIMDLLGLKDVARDCFERLLIVDPEHAEAREHLKALGESIREEGN